MKFIKRWGLLFSLLLGGIGYFVFSRISILRPTGLFLYKYLPGMLPYLIFLMLYVTFCRIEVSEFKPRAWHFWLQGIRILLSGILVILAIITDNYNLRLILEGVFVCVICPTAAAAPVITERLGGNITSLTVYTLIANVVTAIIIPFFFPILGSNSNVSFLLAFIEVLHRVTAVLLIPLILSLLTRKFFPKFISIIRSAKNLPFYIWCFNLSIVMSLTVRNILHTEVSGIILSLLLLLPLFVAIFLFGIGKFVGGYYGESIGAGQALGQKNTIVGIWLTLTFLNPMASLAPCAYVVWQNIINAWQLWYKDKYGRLRW